MRIAVEFSADFADAGDLLADALAYEAAGADALLVGGGSGASGVMLGALAVTCRRARIGPLQIEREGSAARVDALVSTLDRLSRGRLVLLAGAPMKIGERGLDGLVLRQVPPEALRVGPLPLWVRVAFPKSKPEWKETRAAYATAGAAALIVARDPRLLDLLRNPDVMDDRADLNISVG